MSSTVKVVTVEEMEVFDYPLPHLNTRQKVHGFVECVRYGFEHQAIKPERAVEMLQMAVDALMELYR